MSARKISTFFVFGAGTLFLANCSDDPAPSNSSAGSSSVAGGGAATVGGGAPAAGTSAGGSITMGGGGGSSGSSSAGTSSAGGTSAGSGGTSGGSAGSDAGTGGRGGSGGGAGGSGGSGGGGTFALTSADLMNGGTFQDKNTCNGKAFGDDESPAFAWTEPPAGTKSFAMTFIDITLTATNPANPLGHHWMAYNIPAATRALPADLPDGATLTSPVALKQVPTGYLGPCPGGTLDSYEFTLYALSVDTIDPGAGGSLTKAMVDKIKGASLGSAVLGGKSAAKSK